MEQNARILVVEPDASQEEPIGDNGLHRELRLRDGSRIELTTSQYGSCLRISGYGWHAMAEMDWRDLSHLAAMVNEATEKAKSNLWNLTPTTAIPRQTVLQEYK